MRSAFLTMTRHGFRQRTLLPLWFAALLSLTVSIQAEEAKYESRTWTDRQGNQLTATFVDAKNGEVQFKDDAGEIQKFKLADFSVPDQKYLRELAAYRRKLAAGEKPELPPDPARASLDIQPRQTITEPVPDTLPFRKPLLDFPIRTWTDAAGKKVQGKLVTAYNDKVVIDVKGNVFDLAITRLSPDDQHYVAVQLKGLQRDDLVNVLAKAAASTQQQPAGVPVPVPTAVATNDPTPAATLGTDDIRARLEQLKAQRQGNPDTGTQVATATPPAQPLSNDDIKARLAQIRQQKGEPEPQFVPASIPPSSVPPMNSGPLMPPGLTPQQAIDYQKAQMERHLQETQDRLRRMYPPSKAAPPVQTQVMVKKCSKCGRVVPDSTTVGDSCPGCGIKFNYDETDVSGSIGYRIGQGLGVILIISLVVLVIKKLAGG